jgi:parallel beta-helix repeat protein
LKKICILLAAAAAHIHVTHAQGIRTIQFSPSTDNIQNVIKSSPAGSTFIFEAGVYRNLSIAVRPGDTFLGMPGAVLNGSEPLKFVQEGNLWAAQTNPSLPEIVNSGVPCDRALKNADGSKYTVGCTHSRSLYRGGEPLWRVETTGEVAPGKWFSDERTKVVYVADDPHGDILELGETLDAFHGSGANVTIKGFTIEKYAGAQQHGAINCTGGNWLIQGNVIQLNHARGISFGQCDGIRILANTISRNGNLGVGGSLAKDAIVQGNEIDANNYCRVGAGWEAGGGKWAKTTNLTVRENKVRDNLGPGVWSDIGAEGTLYSGNIVTNNLGPGIMYEISRHARIEKNTVTSNGNPTWHNPWLWDAQILISTSSDVVVENNTVIVGEYGNGITITDQNRGSDPIGERRSINNRVTGNRITYQGDKGGTGAASDREKPFQKNSPNAAQLATNVFDVNTYHFLGESGTKRHFYWNGSVLDWDEFRAAGNEKNGTAVLGK